MLGRYGETLVVDWGLAKSVDGPEERPADRVEQPLRPSSGSRLDPTQAGSALGTPAYMSPEQANGRLDLLGPRSDVYCLGATLYHLLTGRAPCEGDQVGEVIQKVVSGAVPRPRSVNPGIATALEAVCLKALALRPDDRYETAEALKTDVERWLADEPVTAYVEPMPARLRRWARRHQRLVTGATAASLVAAAALVTITVVISTSNRRLETSNHKLASANQTILQNSDQITRQNQALEESNQNLKQARAEAEKERDQAMEVTAFLVSSFRKPDPAQDGRKVTVAEVLGRTVTELEERAKMAPRTRAIMLNAVGETYYGLGLVPETVIAFEKSFALRRQELGDDHPDTLESRNNLATAYHAAGQPNRAIPLFEQVLKARQQKLGEDHLDTLESRGNLAVAFRDSGQLDRAIPLYEQVLRARRARLGDDHPDTLKSMDNLAVAYVDVGRLDRALPLQEQALNGRRARLGDEHPQTLRSVDNLARAYLAASQLDRAIPLFEQSLKARRAKLGDDHPDTLGSTSNLALAYLNAGQLDRAIPLFEQALTAQRAKLGDDHPETLVSLHNLASALGDNGLVDRASLLHEQAIKAQRATRGEDHPYTSIFRTRIRPNVREGRAAFRDAEPMYRRTVEAAGRQRPRNDRFYSGSLVMLGRCLIRQEKHAEAVPILRECLELKEKTQPGDWRTALARSLLGEALAGQREFPAAESLLLDAQKGLTGERARRSSPGARLTTLQAPAASEPPCPTLRGVGQAAGGCRVAGATRPGRPARRRVRPSVTARAGMRASPRSPGKSRPLYLIRTSPGGRVSVDHQRTPRRAGMARGNP